MIDTPYSIDAKDLKWHNEVKRILNKGGAAEVTFVRGVMVVTEIERKGKYTAQLNDK